MRIALVSCALLGCAYRPGSFTSNSPALDFPGQRVSAGCLDIAVDRRADMPVGPVLSYEFANRCDRAVTIDLAALAVVGRDAGGEERALRPYDPQRELHRVVLDGRSAGHEALAYPSNQHVQQLCVDAAGLAAAAEARWLCFSSAAPIVIGRAP
jgi:hypothetical protein